MRKRRHRQILNFAEDHMHGKWQSQELKPGTDYASSCFLQSSPQCQAAWSSTLSLVAPHTRCFSACFWRRKKYWCLEQVYKIIEGSFLNESDLPGFATLGWRRKNRGKHVFDDDRFCLRFTFSKSMLMKEIILALGVSIKIDLRIHLISLGHLQVSFLNSIQSSPSKPCRTQASPHFSCTHCVHLAFPGSLGHNRTPKVHLSLPGGWRVVTTWLYCIGVPCVGLRWRWTQREIHQFSHHCIEIIKPEY